MVITMAKLRMAHASTHGARKPPGPKERNYFKRMNLPDARIWFRYRCKITKYYIEGNMSSAYRDNMSCRYCTSG